MAAVGTGRRIVMQSDVIVRRRSALLEREKPRLDRERTRKKSGYFNGSIRRARSRLHTRVQCQIGRGIICTMVQRRNRQHRTGVSRTNRITLRPKAMGIGGEPGERGRRVRGHEWPFDVVFVVLLVGVERIGMGCRGEGPVEEQIRRDRLEDVHRVRFGLVGSRCRRIVACQVCSSAFHNK